MKRRLVIGDIHGGLKALTQVLERAKVTPEDTLIFLGDYVDGWSESAQTIEYLIELSGKQNCVFILGNHDLWCKLWLEKGATNPIWLAHGGQGTIDSYIKTGYITQESHRNFFSGLKNYYIDNNNRLFVHAGFTSMHGVEKEYNENDFYWDRTLWEAARILKHVKEEKQPELETRLGLYNEIYIGHTPTTNYGEIVPMNSINLWNIDTGAAFTGKLTVLNIDTKEYWQSDSLTELYPNEKGRN
ncbi:serine/threonine protein phosphatase [Maribacter algarum]|uniref:Serine/threonine protein phosphatase n=1 Tax=Maribacter algarum (ex Zhang et al. 2020) TaxID=2578118 RepID=A0A5S3PMP1_9FLAO|nr:metallophosphoesterase family protein [Maribacter algarum]TMM55744.1 serine/threonine protein phosphatase [Maribacter algarum]